MGRGMLNRGRIGIQPYPVDDLQLQGYVPKTLYMPDDIGVQAAIALGQYQQETRTLKTDENGYLYTKVATNNGFNRYRIYIHSAPMIMDSPTRFHYTLDTSIMFEIYTLWFIEPPLDTTGTINVGAFFHYPNGYNNEVATGTLSSNYSDAPMNIYSYTPSNVFPGDYISETVTSENDLTECNISIYGYYIS